VTAGVLCGRFVESQLFGVQAADPPVYALSVAAWLAASPFELRRRNAAGIVFTGGIELRGPLTISPEIRYGRRLRITSSRAP
jgi:hypothetical protein